MFHVKVVNSKIDPWWSLAEDDPVRSEISPDLRVGDHAEMIFLVNEQDEPAAVMCVKYCSTIPATVEELLADRGNDIVAVFYTIWSYQRGVGGRLIIEARKHINRSRPGIGRFVTLSPPTTMARRFHLKNGAVVLRENHGTINYEYV